MWLNDLLFPKDYIDFYPEVRSNGAVNILSFWGLSKFAIGDESNIVSFLISSCSFRWSNIFYLDLRSGIFKLSGLNGSFYKFYNYSSSFWISENPRDSSNYSYPLIYSILSITRDRNFIPASLQSLYLRIRDQVQPITYRLPTD